MAHKGVRRPQLLILAALATTVMAAVMFRILSALPSTLRMTEGEVQRLDLPAPWAVSVHVERDGVLRLAGNDGAQQTEAVPVSLESVGRGHTQLEFRLFGWLPLHRLAVDVLPPIKVVPGGQSIGVRLQSQGVMVVGHASIVDADGKTYSPGREAGIELGDVIVSVAGHEAQSEDQVARVIDQAGRQGGPVEVVLRRDGATLHRAVQPRADAKSQRFRIGLYVRDGAAGVGTLTFYDPRTRTFGALGHIITDADTNRPIDVRSGEIVQASVSSIDKGQRNVPGEKIGVLDTRPIGTIERNTRHGIIGRADDMPPNPYYREPIPIALANQVREGPAEILTVVQGREVQRFAIEIVRVQRQNRPDGRGMVLRITDPRLIERTGGIVQGMSGSPIIQDGRLVGAVTHVFVNDPTRGYGVFIEWMLQESGILNENARAVTPGGAIYPGFFLPVSRRLLTNRAIDFQGRQLLPEEDSGTVGRINYIHRAMAGKCWRFRGPLESNPRRSLTRIENHQGRYRRRQPRIL